MIDLARPEGAALRLFLLRHGEPDASSRGRCYGKLDYGLSERGRASMARLASCLRDAGLAAVYASPRRRALESAKVLARACRLEAVVEPRFAEIDFGALEGMTYDEARERFPDLYARWMERPTEVEFPGGESFERMKRRVLEGARELRARHGGSEGAVAIVSHGGVNRILLAEALGLASGGIFRLGQSYGAVNVVDYFGGTPVVAAMNAAC